MVTQTMLRTHERKYLLRTKKKCLKQTNNRYFSLRSHLLVSYYVYDILPHIYISQFTQPSQYRCTQLQFRFAVISKALQYHLIRVPCFLFYVPSFRARLCDAGEPHCYSTDPDTILCKDPDSEAKCAKYSNHQT